MYTNPFNPTVSLSYATRILACTNLSLTPGQRKMSGGLWRVGGRL